MLRYYRCPEPWPHSDSHRPSRLSWESIMIAPDTAARVRIVAL